MHRLFATTSKKNCPIHKHHQTQSILFFCSNATVFFFITIYYFYRLPVVYFDQHLGDVSSERWSNSPFWLFCRPFLQCSDLKLVICTLWQFINQVSGSPCGQCLKKMQCCPTLNDGENYSSSVQPLLLETLDLPN